MQFNDPAHRHVLGVAEDAPLDDWYDLLGVPKFEADAGALEQAMLARVTQVRRYQVGSYQPQSLALLGELSHAYVCLTDPESKFDYDRSLRPAEPEPPVVESPFAAGRVAASACPQCGKPMPAAGKVCYQCGYRAPAAKTTRDGKLAAAGTLPAAPRFSAEDLVRQDLSPRQLLDKLNLHKNVHRAQRAGMSAWTSAPPVFCHSCRKSLSFRTDACGLTSRQLAEIADYVAQCAKRLEAQGKTQFQWPLPAQQIRQVQDAIEGRNSESLRLFCRTCVERFLKSPKVASGPPVAD